MIGICDDLDDPNMNLYMSNLPTQTSLNWQISYENPKSITLTSDTQGVTLNAILKNVSHPDLDINFQATSTENLDIKFIWSIPERYFELQRSRRSIDFTFLISQTTSSLDVTGNFQGGEEGGFIIDFSALEGLIYILNDLALDAGATMWF